MRDCLPPLASSCLRASPMRATVIAPIIRKIPIALRRSMVRAFRKRQAPMTGSSRKTISPISRLRHARGPSLPPRAKALAWRCGNMAIAKCARWIAAAWITSMWPILATSDTCGWGTASMARSLRNQLLITGAFPGCVPAAKGFFVSQSGAENAGIIRCGRRFVCRWGRPALCGLRARPTPGNCATC